MYAQYEAHMHSVCCTDTCYWCGFDMALIWLSWKKRILDLMQMEQRS